MTQALPDAECSPANLVTPDPSPGLDVAGATQGYPYFSVKQPVNAIHCGADGISMYLAPAGVQPHNPATPPKQDPYVIGANFIVVVETGDDADWITRMCRIKTAMGSPSGVNVYNVHTELAGSGPNSTVKVTGVPAAC